MYHDKEHFGQNIIKCGWNVPDTNIRKTNRSHEKHSSAEDTVTKVVSLIFSSFLQYIRQSPSLSL